MSTVLRETHDGVALLRLNRPEQGNALDAALLDELVEATAALDQDRAVQAVVLTGAGPAFCTGGDLQDLRQAITAPAAQSLALARRLTDALARVVLTLHRLEVPVIAAVNGQAAGAGVSLALACDLRIASRRAALHFAYGTLGASPDGGMTWLLPRMVGPARALRLLLDQPVLRAPRALAEGLVDEVVEPADLLRLALLRARTLGATAPHATRVAKQLTGLALTLPLEEHLRLEHREFTAGLRTEDMRRGVTAHGTGELPDFRGD